MNFESVDIADLHIITGAVDNQADVDQQRQAHARL